MPGPGELPAQQPARIIGREAGLARLRALVDPVPLGWPGPGRHRRGGDGQDRAAGGTRLVGPGQQACGCCRSPAGNQSPGSRSPGCISSCGRSCPAPRAFPAGLPRALQAALGLDPYGCPRPAPSRVGRPDPALGPVRALPGPGGRRRRPLAGPQLAGRAGLRRQPPGRRPGCAAGGRPRAGPACWPSTAASPSCTWSRSPPMTPAARWTASPGCPAGGPGPRRSPRPRVIRWR